MHTLTHTGSSPHILHHDEIGNNGVQFVAIATDSRGRAAAGMLLVERPVMPTPPMSCSELNLCLKLIVNISIREANIKDSQFSIALSIEMVKIHNLPTWFSLQAR